MQDMRYGILKAVAHFFRVFSVNQNETKRREGQRHRSTSQMDGDEGSQWMAPSLSSIIRLLHFSASFRSAVATKIVMP